MRLDYSHARMNFHATARSCEGYRPAYRLLFATLIDELETKNQYLSEHGCMLRVDFEAMIRFTGQNRKTFYEGLNWLHAHGFIGYGDTNKDTGIMQILCLPVAGSSAQSVSVTASVPVEMVTATVTGPAPGLVTKVVTDLVTPVVTNPVTKLVTPVVTEIVTDPLTGTNPPPHPPIEEKNNILASSITREVFVPSNLNLTPEERSDLTGLFGIEKAQRLLAKVSRYRRDGGRNDKRSDYVQATGWALTQLEEDERQMQHQKPQPAAKPDVPPESPPKPARIGRQIE